MGRNYSEFTGDKNPNYKTGFASVRARSSGESNFYNSWQNMKARCLNVKHPKYHRYGGRGISIHDDWLKIEGFSKWALSNGWEKGLTLDRTDNNGNYCPDNCRWVSMSANSRKKSTTKLTFNQAITIRERHTRGEDPYALAEEYGVVHGTIWFIIKNFTHVKDGKCSEMIRKRRLEGEKR